MHRNALAAHLRTATHSRRITPKAFHNARIPLAHAMPVPKGMMLPGLGSLGVRLATPKATRLGSPPPARLRIPLDHRLASPRPTRLPTAAGKFVPGMGSMDFMPGMGDDGAEMDFMPGMGDDSALAGPTRLVRHAAASPHRKPVLRKVQKPRIMGAKATVNPTAQQGFMPGLGEEDDIDIIATGYLSADELAADEIPANVGPQAVAAATSSLGKMGMIVGAALLLGAFLKLR